MGLVILLISGTCLFFWAHALDGLDINMSLMIIAACLTHGAIAFSLFFVALAVKKERAHR